jgi:hypothetical protein
MYSFLCDLFNQKIRLKMNVVAGFSRVMKTLVDGLLSTINGRYDHLSVVRSMCLLLTQVIQSYNIWKDSILSCH